MDMQVVSEEPSAMAAGFRRNFAAPLMCGMISLHEPRSFIRERDGGNRFQGCASSTS